MQLNGGPATQHKAWRLVEEYVLRLDVPGFTRAVLPVPFPNFGELLSSRCYSPGYVISCRLRGPSAGEHPKSDELC